MRASFAVKAVTRGGAPYLNLIIDVVNADVIKPCDYLPGPVFGVIAGDGTLAGNSDRATGGLVRALATGNYFIVARDKNPAFHPWPKVGPQWGSIWFYNNEPCESAEIVTVAAGEAFTLEWNIR